MSYKTTKVEIPVNAQKMQGTLYVPDSKELLPGILILHGRGSSQKRYTDRAEMLADYGFATLAFSFRGCGNSDGDFKDQTIKMGQEDAQAGLNYLLSLPYIDKERIGVFGASFGGYHAAILSKKNKIKSLILSVPANYKDEWWEIVPEKLQPNAAQKYRAAGDFKNNKAIKAINQYTGNLLVIEHEQDDICPAVQVRAYADKAINATEKDHIIIKDLGHRLEGKEKRAESNTITLDWFSKTLILGEV